MNSRSRRKGRRAARRWRRFAAGALLLLVLARVLPAAAADAIDISAAVGFADTFQPGRWTPLIVTVTNRGRDLTGELEVQVTGGNELRARPFLSLHRRKLELARGARKALQFTVYPQSLFHPIVIRVLAQGQEIARSELDLRTYSLAEERMLVVLSRDAQLDYLSERNGLRVVHPHPELLPVHWRGYQGVAAMVLHGVSLERLSALQFDALRKWLAQGGVLAVSGSAEYTLLRTPRLAALLPGLPSGMTRADPAALREAFPPTIDFASPLRVHRIGAPQGETRLKAGDLALIVERSHGLGRVLYFTFDVADQPFDRWDGMRAFWLEHLRIPPPAEPAAGNAGRDGLLTAMVRAESADFPSYLIVLLFVALYAGLLLAGYQMSARGRLRSLAPPWSWTAPALLALAAWLLFGPAVYPRGATAIMVAAIEPIPGSGYARLDLDLGLYANRSGALRLEYRGAEPALYPRQIPRASRVTDWVLGEGPRPYLEPRDGRRYVLHAVKGEDVIAFDLQASVHDDAMGPRVRIDNASGRTLEDVRMLFDGDVYTLGSVAAGARSERRFTRAARAAEAQPASWRDLLEPPPGAARHGLEPVAVLLERKAKEAGEHAFPARGEALLVGYTASPLRLADGSAEWPRRERALVAWRVAALPAEAAANRAPASGGS